MKIRILLTAVALTWVGCGEAADGPTTEQTQQDGAATGTLALNLTSSDSDGRAYRLRNATFNVSSYYFDFPGSSDGGPNSFNEVISTEDDVDAPVLTLKLIPGYYDVILTNPDWYLERREAGAWERVEQAVLLTSNYQSAYVYDRGVASVNFRFGVDGELIDFRSGDLQIGISIEQPGEGAGDAGTGILGGLGGLLGGFGGTIGGGFVGGTAGGGFADAGAPL